MATQEEMLGKLTSAIKQQNELKQQEFFYSWRNQKELLLHFAFRLYVESENEQGEALEPEQAIEEAFQFMEAFRRLVIDQKTRRYLDYSKD